jgi:hypothetical protein
MGDDEDLYFDGGERPPLILEYPYNHALTSWPQLLVPD